MNIIEEFGLDEENFIWQDMAMCHGIPTDAFFDDADAKSSIEWAVKGVCEYCPVKRLCQDTVAEQKGQGIHGGERFFRGKIVG